MSAIGTTELVTLVKSTAEPTDTVVPPRDSLRKSKILVNLAFGELL